MTNEILLLFILCFLNLILLIVLLLRVGKGKDVNASLDSVRNTLDSRLDAQEAKNNNLRESLDRSFATLRSETNSQMNRLTESVAAMRGDNNVQLERMRATVSEKLDETLETRLSKSFEQVQKQLESVYKGLGEMQSLAKDVGDLSRIFSNVKARGVWGEVQARAILEDILTPDQYEVNFHPKTKSAEVVEFAIKLPGKGEGENVYLPIDSKFPREDYEKYLKAKEEGSVEEIKFYQGEMRKRVLSEAKDIKNKYINPPRTTDFAVLFLPTESLYAEILSVPGFFEELQTSCHVTLSGPTTLSALVNSLQMGFRSLTVEKRSHEVWQLFAQMKKQFSIFASSLASAERSLTQAAGRLEDVSKRSERIGRRLESIELPEQEVELPLENE